MRAQVLLLAVGALGLATSQTVHYDATRYYKHQNDNGQQQVQADVGDPGTRGFKNPAQDLNPKTRADTQRTGGAMATLAEALMMTGTDGFTAVTLENNPSSVVPAADIGRGVVGSDTGSQAWYFMAPSDRFSGDLSAAYNGKLSLTLVHAETPSMGKVTNYPDVVLEAKCGHSLQLFGFAAKGGDLSVMLNEDAGWVDSRTKKAPSALDVLGVLSHLSAVKIRGGYYAAAESTRISSVKIVSGKKWYPCCTIDGTVDICQKMPSSYYNPDGLKFYCEGHMYRPVKVTRVIPRFSRRTGGATITVMGENFGLTGSQPIVRVNGRACARTMFPASVVRDQSNAADTGTANMFALAGTGIRVVMPNNPAGNALMNAYSSATDSMKQQYPEHCWNGMKDDGTDTGYNYGTATSAKYINQGETGVDTGGPCFPRHCSSCPVGSAGAFTRCSSENQIVAVSSGTCKGRGGTALCDFKFPYLKYPALCPDDGTFTSSLKSAYTASLTSPSGTILADERRTLLTKMFNKNGMYATLNKKHEITEGMTTVIRKNPALDSSLATATSTVLTSIEVADAVALCGMDIYAVNGTTNGDVESTATSVILLNDPTDVATNYFHSTQFGSVNTTNYAYIKIGNEIMQVSGVATTTLTISQRGAFGTPVAKHPSGSSVFAVEVCKNSAVSFTPAAATGKNYFITAMTKNAVCHGFDRSTAYDGRHCTLTVDATSQLANKLQVGDIVRRIATGRTRVASGGALSAGGTNFKVESVAELMGAQTSGSISCGADTNLTVSSVSLATNTITLVSGSVSSACAAGAIVTLTDGGMLDPGPNLNTYTTSIDVLSRDDLTTSDVQEFTVYRYLKIDKEIVRILAVADAVTTAAGEERLTVARAQLGTHAAAHSKGAKIELLPRVTEISAAVTASTDTIYFPTAQDIIGNNIGPATLGSGLQAGGSVKAAYIKIDDEVMKVTAISRNNTDSAYAEVLRAQQGTLATSHSAGTPVYIMSCMDSDETGNNCGGSCKPCSVPAKGGPVQHDMLVCVTPPGDSGQGSAGQGADDVAVTVEASPGPKESPFNQRMKGDMTGWLSMSSSSESCISEQNRGFQYGAHDFVWGVHFKSDEQPAEVMVTDMTIDRNTGESYIVGTMQGKVTVQGKHVAMNGALDGRLSVTPSMNSYLADTVSSNAATTTLVLDTGGADIFTDGDLVGARVKLLAGTADARLYGCTGTVSSYVNQTRTLTVDSLTRTKDATCSLNTAAGTAIRIYFGMSSFIAKLGKDGRTIWLNKLDTTIAGGSAVITSIAMDPGSAKIYVAGYYGDSRPGVTVDTTLNIYSVDTTTRVSSSTTAATINLIPTDDYGQVSGATTEGNNYQEGFLISYSSLGAYEAHESIKGKAASQQLMISNLKVKTYHPTTSNIINTQILSGRVPATGPTHVTRSDVDYDRGMIAAAGTHVAGRSYSSVTLATSAAQYFPAKGQTLSGTAGSAMDNWYNGLKLTITCGKGMGQVRTIQDYDAATRTAYIQPQFESSDMTPDTTSCYMISGKPTSFVKGVHYASGGIYVAGTATSNTEDSFMCFGKMPDSYKDKADPNNVPVCAQFGNATGGEETVNFVSQYDKDLRVYWTRFIYDKAGSTSESGEIKGIAAVDDLVIVSGTFGYHASRTDEVEIAIQNCTFDTDTVVQGPPVNDRADVATIKKLCRTQVVNLVDIGLLPMQKANPQTSGDKAQTGQVTATQGYVIRNTVPADYINVSTGYTVTSSSNKQYMYVAAFDGSGACRWFHYVAGTSATNGNFMITPTALTHVTPAIGDKPLTGYWKTLWETERLYKGRGQPRDATSAKDVSSEKFDTAVIKAGYIYVAGSVKTTDDSSYADFGVTKYPLECSMGKTIGAKGADVDKLKDAQCAGKVVSSDATYTDVFLAKYATLGAPRTDMTMTTYGSGRQPEVQYIRRTGMSGTAEVATGLVVHDLTAAVYVAGTYTASATTKYQGSDDGEKTKFSATEANDGSYTVTPSLATGVNKNNGDDIFGLSAAGRVNALGCPRQRAGPASTHEEKLGLTGVPDCTMYSHASSTTTTTGFVAKFSDNGDETERGNKNRKTYPSITGTFVTGTNTKFAPCSTESHTLTGTSACSTSAKGCSCLQLVATSKTSGALNYPGDTTATANQGVNNAWSGMRIKIVSGRAAGYEGIVSYSTTSSTTSAATPETATRVDSFYTIPALSTLPDESSTFQLFPWAELNPKLHKRTCDNTDALDHGCAAYGIQWAKTVGWPVGQTLLTRNPYGGPSDVKNGDTGPWQTPKAASTSTAVALDLNLADAVTSTNFYNDYIVYLSQSSVQPYVVTAVAQVTGYTVPPDTTSGGILAISCPAIAAGCPVLTQASGHRYKLEKIKGTSTKGLPENPSVNSKVRQTSTPQVIVMQDSDVYISGTFKGFDQHPFGIEGVDETVGYKSVGDDTYETYLVKLQD